MGEVVEFPKKVGTKLWSYRGYHVETTIRETKQGVRHFSRILNTGHIKIEIRGITHEQSVAATMKRIDEIERDRDAARTCDTE